jgi:hypothetical protein
VTNRKVPGSSDIMPPDLPEPVAGHRIDYWTWVEKHADTASRDPLLLLRDHWRECNTQFFDGIMLEPYITLTEPSAPQVYGQCCSLSSWGSRLEIRIRPSLLNGTHPQIQATLKQVFDPRSGEASYIVDHPATKAGRLKFVEDVLLHEMIHQHITENQPGVDESSYHGHGPVFTGHCNRIGQGLGLSDVVVRNRKKGAESRPKAAQWPYCVAPPERYNNVYKTPQKRVTASCVAVPENYLAVSVAATTDNKMEIGFVSATGDGQEIYLELDTDTAVDMTQLITEYLATEEFEE